MIQQQTILDVSDNSGAKKVKCIKVLGGHKRKIAFVGDTIIISIKNLRNKSKKLSKVKKGEVHKALIIKTKSKIFNRDGSNYNFTSNSVCLLTKQNKPIGSRILGPVSKIFRKDKYTKFVSISTGTV